MQALENYAGMRKKAETRMLEQEDRGNVVVQLSWCSTAVGAVEVARRIKAMALKYGLGNVETRVVGCIGLCSHEPIMTVKLPGEKEVSYSRVTPDMAEVIIYNHVMRGKIIRSWLIQ